MTGSQNFQRYTKNFNRIAMIELIDDLCAQASRGPLRASLVANPLTNVPYGGYDEVTDGGALLSPVTRTTVT